MVLFYANPNCAALDYSHRVLIGRWVGVKAKGWGQCGQLRQIL